MTVKVDARGWDRLRRTHLRDREIRVTSALPYAFVASDAAAASAQSLDVRSLDAERIAADLLDGTKVRCPVATGALRDSLEVEGAK